MGILLRRVPCHHIPAAAGRGKHHAAMHIAWAEIVRDDCPTLDSASTEDPIALHIGSVDAGHAPASSADIASHHIVINAAPEADSVAAARGRCAIVEAMGVGHRQIATAGGGQITVGAVIQQAASIPGEAIDAGAGIDALPSTC